MYQNKVAAEISVYTSNNTLFLGVEGREALGVDYNDQVTISIPEANYTVQGFLDSSHQIHVGAEKARELDTFTDDDGHIEAFVSGTGHTWELENAILESRWDDVFSLAAKIL